MYYRSGKLHRIGAPAFESSYGNDWYLNGEHHRIDGPAVETPNFRAWLLYGQYHRLDGPALERGYENWWKTREWWIYGERCAESEFNTLSHRNGVYYNEYCKRWFRNGKLHRVGGPAVEYTLPTGDYEWWNDGERECLTGPAVEYKYRALNEWWIRGIRYTEQEFNILIRVRAMVLAAFERKIRRAIARWAFRPPMDGRPAGPGFGAIIRAMDKLKIEYEKSQPVNSKKPKD